MLSRHFRTDTFRNFQGLIKTTGTASLTNLADSLVENFKKSNLLHAFKISVLGLSQTDVQSNVANTTGEIAVVSPERSEAVRTPASLKETFPGVFAILDKFPTENHSASLQSLAEIGALFPDASMLHQFHQSEHEASHVHQHLCHLQLRFIQQLSPSTALDVYKALAVLKYRPMADVHDALFANVMNNAATLELAQMASLLQARLMMQPVMTDAALTEMSQLLSTTLQRSKKRNVKDATYVAHVLDLYARYQLPDTDVLDEAVEFLRTRVKGMNPADLVSVVHSLTALETSAGKLFDAIVLEVLHRGPDRFELSQLAKLAASLTEIKHFDVMTDVLMDSIAISCQKRMQNLTFLELVDLLWAYAHHMHFHHDAKVLESLASALVKTLPSNKKIPVSLCVKLCDVMAASELSPEHSCQILETVSNNAASSLKTLKKEALFTVMNGCRKARFVCSRLMSSIRDAFEERSEQLTLSDLCLILNSFAHLDENPGDVLVHMALLKTHEIYNLSPTQVLSISNESPVVVFKASRLIWSLAYFSKLTFENCSPLFEHLKSFSRSNFSALDMQKLLLSEKLILLENKSTESEGLIPEPLRSELTTTWKERIYFTRSISPFQQDVSRRLSSLNIQHEAESLIDNGELSVDFLLFLSSARTGDTENPGQLSKIVLECDGPRRRAVNDPKRSLGQTMSFKKVLKAQGWQVYVICKDDWCNKTPNQQEELLKRTLKIQ